jgi:hypothetical protein
MQTAKSPSGDLGVIIGPIAKEKKIALIEAGLFSIP